jgi:hypothetical protein
MSYVLVYYDSLGSYPLYPSFHIPRGIGFRRKIQVDYNLLDQESISTFLFYMIYLVNIF